MRAIYKKEMRTYFYAPTRLCVCGGDCGAVWFFLLSGYDDGVKRVCDGGVFYAVFF